MHILIPFFLRDNAVRQSETHLLACCVPVDARHPLLLTKDPEWNLYPGRHYCCRLAFCHNLFISLPPGSLKTARNCHISPCLSSVCILSSLSLSLCIRFPWCDPVCLSLCSSPHRCWPPERLITLFLSLAASISSALIISQVPSAPLRFKQPENIQIIR